MKMLASPVVRFIRNFPYWSSSAGDARRWSGQSPSITCKSREFESGMSDLMLHRTERYTKNGGDDCANPESLTNRR